MLLSIVTGTYNRLDYLKNMVQSARDQMPVGIEYEFVITDGGSTDGTIAWCMDQPDVHPVLEGELRGAIRAFTDAAKLATGEYVLLANDDIVFGEDSILRALVYLETHPDCGAVAFQDNRPAPGYPDGYKAQVMAGLSNDGQRRIPLVYAQVGLFRRWLGDEVGWWGAYDPIMRNTRTYGGDNYLSAGIWERGYTVDVVDGVRCDDLIAPDVLRETNQSAEVMNGGWYYRRYPLGVVVGHLDRPQSPQQERLRILYLPLYEPGFGHYKHGLRDALGKVGIVTEVDYLSDFMAAPRIAHSFQPHVILTQFHDARPQVAAMLSAMRAAAPSAVVINWNGDVYPQALLAPDMLDMLKGVDLQLTVNADVLPEYKVNGIRAAYWQIGWEPVDALPNVPAYDVVLQANNYSAARKALGAMLHGLPYKVGIYGRGWDIADGDTLYQFARAAALNAKAKVCIGDNQWGNRGFVSNRLFETMAAGGFMLHQRIPGLHELTGLVAGEHYAEWTDHRDLRKQIAYWLEHEDERKAIARAGQAFVRAHHSFDARVTELFETLLVRLRAGDV